MRTIKLPSENKAAKWMMNRAAENVKNFMWDFFYDVKTIEQRRNEYNTGKTSEKTAEYFWGLLDSGTYLWMGDDDCAEYYTNNSKVIYKLKFVFDGVIFLTATKIK